MTIFFDLSSVHLLHRNSTADSRGLFNCLIAYSTRDLYGLLWRVLCISVLFDKFKSGNVVFF